MDKLWDGLFKVYSLRFDNVSSGLLSLLVALGLQVMSQYSGAKWLYIALYSILKYSGDNS